MVLQEIQTFTVSNNFSRKQRLQYPTLETWYAYNLTYTLVHLIIIIFGNKINRLLRDMLKYNETRKQYLVLVTLGRDVEQLEMPIKHNLNAQNLRFLTPQFTGISIKFPKNMVPEDIDSTTN